MKTKITKTFLKSFDTVIRMPYCSGHYLLWDLDARYYNCGVYGWNYDGYFHDIDTIIITGYRCDYGILPDFETINFFNSKAEAVINNRDMSYLDKCKAVREIRRDFIGSIL